MNKIQFQKFFLQLFLLKLVFFGLASSAFAQWNINVTPDKESVVAGTNITFNVNVDDALGVGRTNAVASITLPDQVTFISATVACDLSGLPIVVCALGDVPANEDVDFRVTLRIDDDYLVSDDVGAGFFALDVTASADNGAPTNSQYIVNVEELVDLKVSQFASTLTPRAGDTFSYSIVVDNFGPSAARDVSIHAALAAGVGGSELEVNIQSCAFSVSQGCGAITGFTCTTGTVTLAQFINNVGQFSTNVLRPITQQDIADCDPGTTPTGRIRGTFRIVAPEDLDLTAFTMVESSSPETNYENNYSEKIYDVTSVSNLSVTKTALGEVQVDGEEAEPYNLVLGAVFPEGPSFTTSSSTVTQGRRIRYSVTAENNGPSEAENVLVTDILPSDVIVVPNSIEIVDQDSASTTGSCSFGNSENSEYKMTCALGTLSATTQDLLDQQFPTSKTITFDVLVPEDLAANSVIHNNVTVASDSFEDDNSDNVATASTIVIPLLTADCNGVFGGTAELDRCGVCEGNGLSCLACIDTEVSEESFTLSSANSQLQALTARAARQLSRASDGTIRSSRVIRRARLLASAVEDLIASIPQNITSCSNNQFCTHTSNAELLSVIDTNLDALNDLLKRTVQRLRRVSGNNQAGSRLISQGDLQISSADTALSGIPSTASTCTTP